MRFSYYPGCSLRTRYKELEEDAVRSANALGFTLEDIPEWQCCGGVYPQARDEIASKLSSVRALVSAKERGQDLVTICSACHHVIKRVNHDMSTDERIRTRVNNYLQLEDKYAGETNVVHYLEVLRDVIGFDRLKEKVINPLKDRKIAAYYGCLLLRPSKEMQFDDPENPTIIEDFIKAIGATPVVYAFRNECCGGYLAVKDREFAGRKCDTIIESAQNKGADCIITACPLCRYNLQNNASNKELPVYFFTELLAEALGLK